MILGWLIDGVPYVSEQGTTFRSIWCVVENLSYEMLVWERRPGLYKHCQPSAHSLWWQKLYSPLPKAV